MRKSLFQGLVSVLLLAPMLWAAKADKASKDAKKLDKELKRVTLIATDVDGRRAVNRVMAKQLGVSGKQLIDARRETGFVYGQLFGAHEMARVAGLTFNQVAEQVKQQHSWLDIGEPHQVDLKEILTSAKKLNKEIDKELDRVASGFQEKGKTKQPADTYNPSEDSVAADMANFSRSEIAQAKYTVHHRGLPPGEGGGEEGDEEGGGPVGPAVGGHGHGPH